MSEDYLMHHGVKGQKHGERRYQNKDGSLTNLGRIHYGVGAARKHREDAKAVRSAARLIKGVRNPIAAAKNLRSVGKVVKLLLHLKTLTRKSKHLSLRRRNV